MEKQKWEYKVVVLLPFGKLCTCTRDELNNELNKCGEEGWELCIYQDGYYIFKRPKINNGQERGNTD